MHRTVHEPGIAVESLDIPRPVVPVYAQRVNRRVWVIRIDVQEFHNPTKVVWIARRLAYKVHMIYELLR